MQDDTDMTSLAQIEEWHVGKCHLTGRPSTLLTWKGPLRLNSIHPFSRPLEIAKSPAQDYKG
jgi:hypothetical protein